MEDARGIDLAAGDHVGSPGECVDGQQGKGGGGGEELGVGGRGEEAAFVEAIEDLAVEGLDADAELGMTEC